MKTNFDNIIQHVVSDENNKLEQNYLKCCDKYGLQSKWLHGYFKTKDNHIFQLKGLVKNGSKMFAAIKYVDRVDPSFISIFTLTYSIFIGDELPE